MNEASWWRLVVLVSRRAAAPGIGSPAVLAAAGAVLSGEADRTAALTSAGPPERHFAARIVRLPDPASDGAVALLVLHDTTEARRSEQMRADFVANASHELRTPLAALLGFVETLRGPAREDAAARERFLGIMQEQAMRMGRVIDDLLSLSRIELNEHVPPAGRVDLGAVLRGVAVLLEQRAQARGMRIALDLPADLPPVRGDTDELTQLFQNLLDNAVKYGRDSMPIEIAARRSPRRLAGRPAVAVSIRDQGDGIASEHIPRLTERFYRVDTARSRAVGGTGVGRAIGKHVVSRHRGALEIESELGRGSVFTVHLPSAEPA
jgi:two-component system phosphate regulon sensor histidine kinase PhoR